MAMETPLSSTRRITRSLAAAQKSAAAAAAGSDSAALFSRAKNAAAGETQAQTRAALQDISNDSPIVGLAAGCLHATDKTPASTAAKTRRRAAPRRTPGSGEALLRGQVKALLHKVEEEQGGAAAAAATALVRPPRIQFGLIFSGPRGELPAFGARRRRCVWLLKFHEFHDASRTRV